MRIGRLFMLGPNSKFQVIPLWSEAMVAYLAVTIPKSKGFKYMIFEGMLLI
jgi:hypothetical protein